MIGHLRIRILRLRCGWKGHCHENNEHFLLQNVLEINKKKELNLITVMLIIVLLKDHSKCLIRLLNIFLGPDENFGTSLGLKIEKYILTRNVFKHFWT